MFSENKTGFVLASSFFCLSLGCVIYNKLYGVNIKGLLKTSHSTNFHSYTRSPVAMRWTAYILGFVSILLSIAYFRQVGISLFADNVGTARLDNRNAASGSFLYQRVFRILFPLVILYFYGLWVIRTKSLSIQFIRISTIFFLIFLTLGTLFLAFTGMKANVFMFLLFPILIFHNLYIAKISIFRSILLVSVALAVLLYLIKKFIPDGSLFDLLGFLLFRVGSGATDGLHYIIHTYEPRVGLQLGSTIINDIQSLFGKLGIPVFSDQSLGQQIAKDLLGQRYNGEQAAVTLAGELYLNFGYLGLIIGSVAIGSLLQWIYVTSLKSKANFLRAIFLAYTQAITLMVLGGPVFSMAFDYAIFLAFFYFFWRVTYSCIILFNKGSARA